MSNQPRVLILGGCGFIGKNLVRYLATNDLVSKICISDKVPPQVNTGGLNDEEKALFDNASLVSFKQANLARESRVDEVFEHDGGNYQYVINLAGITKYSQPEEVYQENIVEVSRVCANAAKKFNCARYIEVSTAQVYKHKQIPNGGWAEDGEIAPWTGIATARLQAENAVSSVEGLNYVIVRPAIVYGVGDLLGITPRLIIGTVYKESGENMELLWSKSLKMNTVHVDDVCRAIWHLTTNGNSGEIYNLVDKSDTDQGKVNQLIADIYGIETSFLGKTKSQIATAVGMKNIVDYVNDKHLKPWSDLCKARGIMDTPLTPYLDEELLYKCDQYLNGAKIESTGFSYSVPEINAESLRQTIRDFMAKGYFPAGLVD